MAAGTRRRLVLPRYRPLAFKAAGTGQLATTDDHPTFSVPAGTQNGDLLVAFLSHANTTISAVPSGWTLAQENQQGAASGWLRMYWKIAELDESSFVWTLGASVAHSGGVVAYTRDLSKTVSVDASAITDANSSSSIAVGSVAATGSDDLLVIGLHAAGFRTVTPPDSMALRGFGGNPDVSVADERLRARGDTGTRTFGYSSSSNIAAVAVAFKQA